MEIPSKLIDNHAIAVNGLSAAARAEFAAIWDALDKSDPVKVKAAVLAAVPVIIDKYAKQAQVIGKEFYMDCRNAVNPDAPKYTPVSDDIPEYEERLKWAVQYLFKDK